MKIYKKRTKLNIIKQHIHRTITLLLCYAGILFLLNQGINYLQSLPNIWKPITHTLIINNAEAEQPTDTPNIEKYLINNQSNTLQGEFSAYTASEDETDASPTIMANNQKVFIGAIANNCLPFGSKIKINNTIYIVSDRMNSRYGCNSFDIFVNTKIEALEFGRKSLNYEVLDIQK